MRGGGRDSPYIPYENQAGQSAAYQPQSMSSGMSCWPTVPIVFSVPASHAEMYYVPQPMGLPTAPVPPYAWPMYACQQPIYSAMEPWQGGPASPYQPAEPQSRSGTFSPGQDRRAKESAEYGTQANLPRGRRQHKSRPPSSSTVGQDRSSASSLKESLLPSSPLASSTSSFQSYRHRQRHPSADQQQAYTAPTQSPGLTDTEGEQDNKSSARVTAQIPMNPTISNPTEPKLTPARELAQTQGYTFQSENPLITFASTPTKPDSKAAFEEEKQSAVAAEQQTLTQGKAETSEGQSRPAAPPKPCMYFLRTGTCDYGKDCKFAHPEDQKPVFTSAGLPIRPGKPLCPFHEQYKWCGFAKGCKFSHRETVEIAEPQKGEIVPEAQQVIPADSPQTVSTEESTEEKEE